MSASACARDLRALSRCGRTRFRIIGRTATSSYGGRTLDRAALNELFDYTTFTWEAYGNAVRALPDGTMARPVDGSEWPALRNVLFHIATARDSWMIERLGIDHPLDATADSVASWPDVQRYRDRTRDWLRHVIDETSDEELQARTQPMFSETPAAMQVTVAEIIAHILLHERGHHGDITTLIAQSGGAPPSIDYLTYVFFKQRQRR